MKNWKPTLGTFSKALSGAVSLNFAESGGVNCSPTCEALIKNVCYAVHTEKMKPSIQKSGERKRLHGFAPLCDAYREEITRKASKAIIPWIRFSTFGSVPDRELTTEEESAFVKLVRSFPPDVPVHFPVETREKAERFRDIAKAYALPLVIRESAQSDQRAMESMSSGDPASRIVYEGKTKRDRLAKAQEIARANPGASVCPAIASTILKRPVKIKCGSGKGGCTLCSQGNRTLILYPQH
jgi:hypothetical protein